MELDGERAMSNRKTAHFLSQPRGALDQENRSGDTLLPLERVTGEGHP